MHLFPRLLAPLESLLAQVRHGLTFTRYCHYHYGILNGKTAGPGGNYILRTIDCKTQIIGVAINEVLNADNSIDLCTIPE